MSRKISLIIATLTLISALPSYAVDAAALKDLEGKKISCVGFAQGSFQRIQLSWKSCEEGVMCLADYSKAFFMETFIGVTEDSVQEYSEDRLLIDFTDANSRATLDINRKTGTATTSEAVQSANHWWSHTDYFHNMGPLTQCEIE